MDGIAIIVLIGLYAYYQEEVYKNKQDERTRSDTDTTD